MALLSTKPLSNELSVTFGSLPEERLGRLPDNFCDPMPMVETLCDELVKLAKFRDCLAAFDMSKELCEMRRYSW